jgi:predicted ATPase
VLAERLTLTGFTAFEDATFEFVPGVNVFIGGNGTGKTHAMKVLYATLRAYEEKQTPNELVASIQAKLAGVFKPDDNSVGRLVRRVRGKRVAEVTARIEGKTHGFTLHQTKRDPVRGVRGARWTTPSSLFLPSREVLAMFEGFTSLYERREITVDETYADVAIALNLPPLRGVRPGALGRVARDLEVAIGARVSRDGPRFYLRETRTGAKIEAHLAAEGHRKVASLLQLISNGALRDRAVLFWDEPEANLNPILSERVVEAIHSLAGAGVQVILATHDYLIASRLSLMSQAAKDNTEVRFFALKRTDDGMTTVDVAARLPDLDDNLLIDAIRDHNRYQREVSVQQMNG